MSSDMMEYYMGWQVLGFLDGDPTELLRTFNRPLAQMSEGGEGFRKIS